MFHLPFMTTEVDANAKDGGGKSACKIWLEEVLILLNSSSSAELQRFSNVCASDFPDNVHKSERTARHRTASIRCRSTEVVKPHHAGAA